MAFTLAQIKSEVKAFLGNRTDLDTRLTDIINLAENRIYRYYPWEETLKLQWKNTQFTGDVTTDKLLDVPLNLGKVITLRLIDGTYSRKLIKKEQSTWDRLYPSPGVYTTNRPQFYTRWKDIFEFWPVPDAEYRIECRFKLKQIPITLDTANMNLTEKDDLIILLSAYWCNASLGRVEEATSNFRAFKQALEETIKYENDDPDLDLMPELAIRNYDLNNFSGEYWNDPFYKG